MNTHPSRDVHRRLRQPAPHGGMAPPDCYDCRTPMVQGELRVPRPRLVSRVGAPLQPPEFLPVWCCPACGCRQPRIEP
jgi:hypothetical protein